MAAKPEDDPRLGWWIEELRWVRAEIVRKEEERTAAVVTGPPGVIDGIDKAIERLSAKDKDLREELSALQANIGRHIDSPAAVQALQEVQRLKRRIDRAGKSTKSAGDVGRQLVTSSDWSRDTHDELLRMLGDPCAEPLEVAEQLLAALPQSWSLLAAAEEARSDSGKRKRAQDEAESGDHGGGQAGAEQPVEEQNEENLSKATFQRGMMCLLSKVKELVPGVCWHLHDTSQSGLAGHQGKVDLSFTASTLKAWPQLLLFGELQARILPLAEQYAAIGQIADRSEDAFGEQPARRSHIFGLAAGRDGVQVVCMRKNAPPLHTRMEPFSLNSQSPGLLLLLRLLFASKHALGFVETQPPRLSIPGVSVSKFDLMDIRAADEPLSRAASDSSTSMRSSQVWRASWQAEGESQRIVAVKVGSTAAIRDEANMLQKLGHTPGVVRLLHTSEGRAGKEAAAFASNPLLVTAPFGRCLDMDDSASTILGAIACAAGTVGSLAQRKPPILHRDISLGNLIVPAKLPSADDGLVEGWSAYALLLDFATARDAPGGEVPSGGVPQLTGTPLFMACSILQGEKHTVSSDLESLFYVLLFLACKGHVHWANSSLWSREALSCKVHSVMVEEYFDLYVRQRCAKVQQALLAPIDRLQKLFFVPAYNRKVSAEEFLKALKG